MTGERIHGSRKAHARTTRHDMAESFATAAAGPLLVHKLAIPSGRGVWDNRPVLEVFNNVDFNSTRRMAGFLDFFAPEPRTGA